MQEDFFTQLRRSISHERLEAYRQRRTDSDDLNLYAHYAWNIALSESLYPALQGLEVSIRNSIHDAASERFKTEYWFDDISLLYPPEKESVRKAKETLIKSKKPLDVGRIIAELNFGFWTSLFDVRYEQRFWPWLLKPVFPSMPRTERTRKTLSQRLNKIRQLRNRIFHHEPIWHWRDLRRQHAELLEAIYWINPAMMKFVKELDRFPVILEKGYDGYKQGILQLTHHGKPEFRG